MKEAGLNLLKLLVISTLLVTTGKLSWDAGLAIGLIFLLPLDWRPRVFFTPHFVSFGADVGKLLVNIGYVSPEAWAAYTGGGYDRNQPSPIKRILHEGLHAVVLSANDRKDRAIHWPQLNRYTSEFFVEEKLEVPCADAASPLFFVRPKEDVYLIGVSIFQYWWERVQNDVPKTGLKSVEFMEISRAYLVLAAIPRLAFDRYYRHEDWKADEKVVAAVKKAGFTETTWGWKTELASVRIEGIPRQ